MAASARAQNLTPVAGTQENGIKIGDGRLHPYIDLELRYDSAAVLIPTGAPSTSTVPAVQPHPELEFHIRPGFTLNVPSSWADFGLSGDADYVRYTGILTPGDEDNSRIEGAANVNLILNREGAVEVDLNDAFSRSDHPRDPSLGVGVLALYNIASVAVPIHPGGRALEITPKLSYAQEFYSPISSLQAAGLGFRPSDANYRNVQGDLDARWRFFPKTALLFTATLLDRSYPVAATNPRADLFRAQAGIAGLLTSRIAIQAKAGWGFDFGQSTGNGFLGMLEATYLFNDFTTLKGGVLRTLEPASTYGTYLDTRPYVEARAFLSGRWTVHGLASYDWLQFSSAKAVPTPSRTDTILSFDAGPELQITRWFLMSAGYILGLRHSSSATNVAGTVPGGTRQQILNYTRHEAYLRATFTY